MSLKEFFTGGDELVEARAIVDELRQERPNGLAYGEGDKLDSAKSIIWKWRAKVSTSVLLILSLALGSKFALDNTSTDDVGGEAVAEELIPDVSNATVAHLEDESGESLTTPKETYTRIETKALTETEQIPQMLELQNQWKAISEDALLKFVDADPQVLQLLDFMKEKAYFSAPTGSKMTQYVFKRAEGESMEDAIARTRSGFEIVYMPEKYAKNMPSSIYVEAGGRTMRIATTFKCKEWLGIMLAHEMSHIYDVRVEGENSKNRDEYLAGEVKAHKLEMRLLESWDPAAYAELIEKGTPFIRSEKTISSLFQLAASLYPLQEGEVSANEASLGMASCIIAVFFEDAMRQGASDEDLKDIYVWLGETLFARR